MSPPSVPLTAIRQPAFLYDAGGRVVEANDRLEALAGRPLAGCSIAEVQGVFGMRPPGGEPCPPAELPVSRALRGEEAVDVPLAVTASDGRVLRVLATASPLRDGDAVTGALVVWQDVSGLASAGEALAESEARFRSVLEGSRDVVYRLNLQTGRYEYFSPSCETVTGYTPGELMAQDPGTLLSLIHPDDRPALPALLDRLEQAGTVDAVYRQRAKDGEYRWISNRLSLVRDDAGRPLYRAGTMRDISSRKRAEEALAKSEEEYRHLVQYAPTGIYEIEYAGPRFRRVNDAMCRILGYTREELMTMDPTDLLDDESRARFRERVRQVQAGEPIDGSVSFRVLGRDGRAIWAALSVRPTYTDGRVDGALVVAHDVTERKRAEEAIRSSEQRLSLAQRAGGVGVFDWDVVTGRTVWTPELEKIYGMPSPSDPAQHHDAWIRRVHPDDRDRLLDRTREWLASSRDEETWEYRYHRPDGQERWIAGRSIVVRGPDNRPLRVIGTNIDITERKRAEEALRESEERFNLALTNAPTVLFTQDRDLRYTWVSNPNPGFSGVDVLGKTDLDLLPAEEAGRLTALKRRVLETGAGLRDEVRTTIGGAPFYYDLTLEPLAGERGETIGVVGVSHDITERVLAEEALRRRAEELEAVMDLVPAAIWIGHDPACRTITGNRLANEFYEAAPGENVSAGRPPGGEPSPRAFFSPDGRELGADELPMQVAAAQNDVVRNAEFEVQVPSGRRRHLLGSAVPLREADGAVRGAIAAFLDITDRKETEEALRAYAEDLRRSNEDLERFAYVSSHDLQEPLRSIISFSQLLERRYRGELGADADEFIEFIVEGGQRMQSLIQDLLAFSRVNTTRQELARTDTADVLAAVERHLDLQLREVGATLTHDPMPTVLADPLQLEQVFANLVSNAIKFRRPDVPLRVHVGARRLDGVWEFSVKDNGIGIEPEYFEKIFVIFQRLHTKDAYPGTGIGLAIVKRIIDRHGGTVRVESVPGEGSTFFFTLPAA